MKPAPFAYHAPTTLDEALDLLAAHPEARPLAGGQSLVPRMRLRVEKPPVIVDLNHVAELDGVRVEGGAVSVGALVRQQTLIEDDDVAAAHPLIRRAGSHAGFATTRHRGTVGGSVAFAAPWAELAATTVLLDAVISVRSAAGQREIPARAFFLGPHATALAAGELVTALHFPAAPAGTGFGFHEASPRYRDYATAAAAAAVRMEGGVVVAAELVLLRAAPAPVLVDVSEALAGKPVGGAALDAAIAAFPPLDPPGDIEASGAHRRRLATTLARRALADAWSAAEEVAA